VRKQIIDEMKREKVKTDFVPKDSVLNPIIANMEKVFQPCRHHLLSYFVLKPHDQANGVDMAILNGLLKSLKPRRSNLNDKFTEEEARRDELKYKAQLRLCLTWNRFDMAEKFILNDENRDKVVLLYLSFDV
jgi:hypothetical protein